MAASAVAPVPVTGAAAAAPATSAAPMPAAAAGSRATPTAASAMPAVATTKSAAAAAAPVTSAATPASVVGSSQTTTAAGTTAAAGTAVAENGFSAAGEQGLSKLAAADAGTGEIELSMVEKTSKMREFFTTVIDGCRSKGTSVLKSFDIADTLGGLLPVTSSQSHPTHAPSLSTHLWEAEAASRPLAGTGSFGRVRLVCLNAENDEQRKKHQVGWGGSG